jgi:hypothetical protein
VYFDRKGAYALGPKGEKVYASPVPDAVYDNDPHFQNYRTFRTVDGGQPAMTYDRYSGPTRADPHVSDNRIMIDVNTPQGRYRPKRRR